jgi:high affinity Mn2+ porin
MSRLFTLTGMRISGTRCWTVATILGAVFHTVGAAAADRAAPPARPPSFSWVGFYIGANIGAGVPLHTGERLQAGSGFGSTAFDLFPPTRERASVSFGAQAGYNWQFGPWVYGAETDLNCIS